VARDASFLNGLSNVSRDHWLIYPNQSPELKGFVRFEFTAPLAAECGVAASSQITDARFSAWAEFGNLNTLLLRRCLMPWNEPPTDWCFGCPGTLTRSHSQFSSVPWHQPGAAAQGGSGTAAGEYYPTGSFDSAATIDATVPVPALSQRIEFAGPNVAAAFRFWFDNPTKNFGYAIEAMGSTGPGMEFAAADRDGGRDGIVLTVSFTLPPTSAGVDCNQNGIADYCDIVAGTSLDVDQDGVPDECQAAIAEFVRADANSDGSFNIADPIRTLQFLFAGSGVSCLDAVDSNDDGNTNVADAVHMLSALFSAGPLPAPPFPACGADSTSDGLGCLSFAACP
jgi:hypothetical protein